MKVIEEEKTILGMLITQNQQYELLELSPRIPQDVSWLVKESAFQFYAVVEGFGQYVLVSKSSFAIIPYLEPKVKIVKFVVLEDDEEEGVLPGSLDVEDLRR